MKYFIADACIDQGQATAEEDLQAIASFGLSIVQQPQGSSICHKVCHAQANQFAI